MQRTFHFSVIRDRRRCIHFRHFIINLPGLHHSRNLFSWSTFDFEFVLSRRPALCNVSIQQAAAAAAAAERKERVFAALRPITTRNSNQAHRSLQQLGTMSPVPPRCCNSFNFIRFMIETKLCSFYFVLLLCTVLLKAYRTGNGSVVVNFETTIVHKTGIMFHIFIFLTFLANVIIFNQRRCK